MTQGAHQTKEVIVFFQMVRMIGKVFDVVENRLKECWINFFALVDLVCHMLQRDGNAPKVLVLVGNDS